MPAQPTATQMLKGEKLLWSLGHKYEGDLAAWILEPDSQDSSPDAAGYVLSLCLSSLACNMG